MSVQNKFISLMLLSIVAIQGNVLKGKDEPLSKNDKEELMNATVLKCGAAVADVSIESVYSMNLNGTTLQEVKCAIGCLLKNLGLITDNNEFDRKGFQNFIELMVNSGESSEADDSDSRWESCNVDEFEEKCATLKAKDECEFGWNFFQCLGKICESKENELSSKSKEKLPIFN